MLYKRSSLNIATHLNSPTSEIRLELLPLIFAKWAQVDGTLSWQITLSTSPCANKKP